MKKVFNSKLQNHKGAIELSTLVTIIVIIASFVIILVLYFRADLSGLTDEQVCYNSVVARSSSVITANVIPLNCKTSYICITKDGTCEMMTSPKIIEVENPDDVYSVLAEKMANCWSIFGAGKLNYVGKDFSSNLYCSNCYQVGFDNSLDMFSNNEIEKRELYRYLASKNVSGTDTTYLEYLIGLQSAQTIENSLDSVNSEFGTISIGKQYYITMGIFSDVSAWKTTVLRVAAVSLLTVSVAVSGGVVLPILILAASGAGYTHFVGVIAEGNSGHQFIAPSLVEANSEDYSKLNCASINTLA
ncbi:hypothetical protein M0R72_05100 [Candidatus Pacearchaeota archaeon]|jgi:hypothetical protein|nr:hypothetical protein [Candidatus Pacearchaeota archaeon]